MAASLRTGFTAAGAERAEQLELLRREGCLAPSRDLSSSSGALQ